MNTMCNLTNIQTHTHSIYFMILNFSKTKPVFQWMLIVFRSNKVLFDFDSSWPTNINTIPFHQFNWLLFRWSCIFFYTRHSNFVRFFFFDGQTNMKMAQYFSIAFMILGSKRLFELQSIRLQLQWVSSTSRQSKFFFSSWFILFLCTFWKSVKLFTSRESIIFNENSLRFYCL